MISLLLCNVAFGQNEQSSTQKFKFNTLSQNDDFSFLKDKKDKSLYEELKFLQLGKTTSLTFGGNLRTQYEYFQNQNFVDNASDGWWLNRFMVHANFRVGQNWQFFGELLGGYILSRENPSPVNRDELTVNQLFAYYDNDKFSVTVGRINPSLGMSRLIAIRNGPNARLYFDGINATYEFGKTKFRGFYYQPVTVNPYSFDNDYLDSDEYIYGLYNTTINKNRTSNLDFYYIGSRTDRIQFDIGEGSEDRHTFGSRYFGEYDDFKLDVEAIYQMGTFENLDISAWTLSVKLIYDIPINDNLLTLGFQAEYISGDRDADDDKLNSFNALYPKVSLYGRTGQIGPTNLYDYHPSIKYVAKKWSVEFDHLAFWRASTEDAVYGVGLNPTFPDVNGERFTGWQYNIAFKYNVNPFLTFKYDTSYMVPGKFLKASNLDNDLIHILGTIEFHF